MKILIQIILAVSVFITALEIVVSQHEARKLFAEIQELEKTRDSLHEEWGRLQLEQSTWATDDRIENLARTKLNMISPGSNSLKMLVQ